MNKRIQELIGQATTLEKGPPVFGPESYNSEIEIFDKEKFAKLLIDETLTVIRQEWYDINDTKPNPDESVRDVGIRVGKKNEALRIQFLIKEHFGVE